MAELAGYSAAIKISGTATSMTAEPTTLITTGLVYQITNTAKQVLDLATPPTVLVGGSAVSASIYTVNYLSGTITFLASATRTVTVTGKYLPMSTAAYAHALSINRATDLLDVTAFSATHKKRIGGLKSASGTINQFDVTDTTYENALIAGVPIVIEYKAESSVSVERYWALLESSEVAAAIGDVQDQTISWISHNKWLK